MIGAIAVLVIVILVTLLKAVFSKDKPVAPPKSQDEIKRQQDNEDRRQYEKAIRLLKQYGEEQQERNPNKNNLTDDLPF